VMNERRPLPTMLDESAEGLSEDDRELLENVKQYGFHWFSIGQSDEDRIDFPEWRDVPGWSYTIGLHASYGHPEIVVFELENDIVGAVFWDLSELIEAGNKVEAGQIYDDVLPSFEGQRFVFEQVSPGWIPSLFGFASWFYKHQDFPVLQYLWPARNGLFVWEAGAAETIRKAQPVLTEPPREEESPPPRRG
jgi:Domain of unknown function (DUF4262)